MKKCFFMICMVCILILVSCTASDSTDQMASPQSGDTIAVIHTSMGDICVKFFPDSAPRAVENFITHARNGYYDGVQIFRVIENFMIQSGDPTNTGTGGESIWDGTFVDEFDQKLHHFNGALSMANRGFNTNGSQFFIVQCDAEAMTATGKAWMEEQNMDDALIQDYLQYGGIPYLDHEYNPDGVGHVIFGQVFDGMDTLRAIASVRVIYNDTATERSKPKDNIIIETIEVKTKE